jgi:hypothetical protein
VLLREKLSVSLSVVEASRLGVLEHSLEAAAVGRGAMLLGQVEVEPPFNAQEKIS